MPSGILINAAASVGTIGIAEYDERPNDSRRDALESYQAPSFESGHASP